MKHIKELNTFSESIEIVEITSDLKKRYAICIKNADPFHNNEYYYLDERVDINEIDSIDNISARIFLNKS